MTTKTMFAGLCIAAGLASCTCANKTKGIVTKAAQEDCIRLWEKGIRLESTDGSNRTAFIVFAPDSMQVELFFSDGSDNEILQRRTLPSGTHVWNVEDDDTKNVRREADGQWTISQRMSTIFRSSREETATELGKMQVHSYEGLLPAASCSGIEFKLTIRNRKHSGNGTFQLTLTYKEAENGEDRTITYNGKRLTMRGIPGDDNATVWQCIANDNQVFNFLREDENTLILLNDKYEKIQTDLNYSLRKVE